jgi:hypothetical protein
VVIVVPGSAAAGGPTGLPARILSSGRLMYKAQLPHHVAYFSMELALDSAMPTYAGGLGVLAGDTLRSAADLGLLMVAVSLLKRGVKGCSHAPSATKAGWPRVSVYGSCARGCRRPALY